MKAVKRLELFVRNNEGTPTYEDLPFVKFIEALREMINGSGLLKKIWLSIIINAILDIAESLIKKEVTSNNKALKKEINLMTKK